MFYRNLSLYHLKAKDTNSLELSKKYIEGAIIAAQSKKQTDQDLSLAISFNNKSVIELRHGNKEAARESSSKAVDLVESRVFSLINSGFIKQLNEEARTTFD
jgi:hypothetical protein